MGRKKHEVIKEKVHGEFFTTFYRKISKDSGVNLNKTLLIMKLIYEELVSAVLDLDEVNIKGFATFKKIIKYPKYKEDKRIKQVYLSKGCTKIHTKMDADLIKKLRELIDDGKTKN